MRPRARAGLNAKPVLPGTWLSVLFFVLLVSPGLLYDLLADRRRVKISEPAFRELSRTVLSSILCSGLALSALALIREVQPSWMPDPSGLFMHQSQYLASHYRLVLRAAVAEALMALGLACLAHYLIYRRSNARLRPVSTWTRVLRDERPEGYLPHVQVQLEDGRTYIGAVGH